MGFGFRGTSEERREKLIRIASCLPGDAALPEELGDNFPKTAAYPEHTTPEIIEKYNFLLKELSTDRIMFSVADTLEKQISCYADFKNIQGKEITVKQRLEDIYSRFLSVAEDPKTPDKEAKMILHRRELIKRASPRILAICGTIEQLLI